MKKILAMAAVMAFASGAYAESEFSHNAEYRVRYQYDQNVTGDKDTAPTSQDEVVHRLKFGTTFKASEKLSATFTLLHNANWGSSDLDPTGNVCTANCDSTGDSGTAVYDGTGNGENMLLVQEAYGSWMISDEFMLRFGRGSFTLADGNLIGTNDWEATPYTFEGVLGTYEMEALRISAWAVRFAEWTRTSGNFDDDPEANNFGVSFDFKSLPDAISLANIHVLQTNADEVYESAGSTILPKQDILRAGVAIGGDVAGFDYHVNYEMATGEKEGGATLGAGNKQDVSTSMYQVELGYTLAEVMNSRFYALYHMDSGSGSGATDDETYDPYFYELHSNAGLMDVVRWGNLTYISLGYTLEPMEDLSAGLHYHMFSKTEEADSTTAGPNGSMLGTTSTNDDKLGDEIDLVATKTYEGGFSITGRVGMFMPGDAIKNGSTAAEDTYTQVYVQGKMNF